MAISNHERVGETLELLKSGLGPFVEREKRASDALSRNGLGQTWPEIMRLARTTGEFGVLTSQVGLFREDEG